jgi:hypothetical protein
MITAGPAAETLTPVPMKISEVGEAWTKLFSPCAIANDAPLLVAGKACHRPSIPSTKVPAAATEPVAFDASSGIKQACVISDISVFLYKN